MFDEILENCGMKVGSRVYVRPDWFTDGGIGTVIGRSSVEVRPVAVEIDNPGHGNFKIVNLSEDEITPVCCICGEEYEDGFGLDGVCYDCENENDACYYGRV